VPKPRPDFIGPQRERSGLGSQLQQIRRSLIDIKRAPVNIQVNIPGAGRVSRAIPVTPKPSISILIPWIWLTQSSDYVWGYWTPNAWTIGDLTLTAHGGPVAAFGDHWINTETPSSFEPAERSLKALSPAATTFADNAQPMQGSSQVYLALDSNGRLWGAFKSGDTWFGSIYYSDDFGDTWTFSWGSNDSNALYDFAVSPDGQKIVLVLQRPGDGIFLGTVISLDGGSSWTESGNIADSDYTTDYQDPMFLGSNIVIIEANYTATLVERILRSTDGGLTWSMVYETNSGDSDYIEARLACGSQCVLEDGTGIFTARVGGVYGILRSTDAGATWGFLPYDAPNSAVQTDALVAVGNDIYILAPSNAPGHTFFKLPNAGTTSDGTLTALADLP